MSMTMVGITSHRLNILLSLLEPKFVVGSHKQNSILLLVKMLIYNKKNQTLDLKRLTLRLKNIL